MIGRVVGGLAMADFRDRVRRPAYAVTLAGAVALGYVAAPESSTHWVIMYLGVYRGTYNSAYIATVTAFASALWLTLGGFYAVRNSIARDERTGVGQLLAATPVRTATYLVGKFVSNCMVLASMVGVLAVTALVLQLARGESRHIDLVALLTPFVFIALPVVALTAAAALVFETVPVLRSGLGNIIWFVVWMGIALGGQSPTAPFGGIGVYPVAASMRASMIAQGIDTTDGEFSLGLMYVDDPLRTFLWPGLHITTGFAVQRLALVLLALALALLPVLWFGRFDPARNALRLPVGPAGIDPRDAPGRFPYPVAEAPEPPAPARSNVQVRLPRTRPETGGASLRLLVGEVRVLLQGVSWWWWAGAAGLTVIGLLLPIAAVTTFLLPAVWLWPILIWSRLGTQRYEYNVESLLSPFPRRRRRLLAEWSAGVIITALVGLAPGLRMVMAADRPGLAAWAGGMLFIPSLALALGVLSRTHRLFQALYLPLWYAIINGIAAVDFMGTVRVHGHPAGPSPLLIGAAALVLLAGVVALGNVRRDVRG